MRIREPISRSWTEALKPCANKLERAHTILKFSLCGFHKAPGHLFLPHAIEDLASFPQLER
jgi:hypothetical protein